ncbi:MAG: hypothetical protein E7325_01040 [Clostridiales bacterium]|nr:hypothetical protein [Clostridiales bacterium]
MENIDTIMQQNTSPDVAEIARIAKMMTPQELKIARQLILFKKALRKGGRLQQAIRYGSLLWSLRGEY